MNSNSNTPQKSTSKDVPQTIRLKSTYVKSEFDILIELFYFYTKKTGAGTKKGQILDDNYPMKNLFESLSSVIRNCTIMMDNQELQMNLRTQFRSLYPMLSHMDRLISNAFHILNDRISLLWRPSVNNQMEEACRLYQDINKIVSYLQIFIKAAKPRQINLSSDSFISFPSQSKDQGTLKLTIHFSPLVLKIVNKIIQIIYRTVPYLYIRTNEIMKCNIQKLINNICKQTLHEKYFSSTPTKNGLFFHWKRKNKIEDVHMSIGKLVIDNILSPYLETTIKLSLDSLMKQKILIHTCNETMKHFLSYLQSNQVPFSKSGVTVLYMEFISMFQWIISAKLQLKISPSLIALGDMSSWILANDILRILSLNSDNEERGSSSQPLDNNSLESHLPFNHSNLQQQRHHISSPTFLPISTHTNTSKPLPSPSNLSNLSLLSVSHANNNTTHTRKIFQFDPHTHISTHNNDLNIVTLKNGHMMTRSEYIYWTNARIDHKKKSIWSNCVPQTSNRLIKSDKTIAIITVLDLDDL